MLKIRHPSYMPVATSSIVFFECIWDELEKLKNSIFFTIRKNAIAKAAGKEKARRYSGHLTNKAFDRYCRIGDDDTFDISQLTAEMRGKVLPLKEVKKSKK